MPKKTTPTDDDEHRKQSRLHKLGTNSPRCCICGNADWRVIEEHHVAGRKHDNRVVLVCANHHRILTDDQKDHPQPEACADELLAQIGNLILGLVDMLANVLPRLREFGEALIARANEASAEAGGAK
jgi:hypothetical protein